MSKAKTATQLEGSFQLVELTDENRTGVMELVNPKNWFAVGYKLNAYAEKYVNIKFSVDIKRVGEAGNLWWQINNVDYPVIGGVENAAPDVWHTINGEWTGFIVHPFIPYFYLSTWKNNSENTTYYIDNFTIEIIPVHFSEYYKALILPEIREDFVVAEKFRNGLTDAEINAGITAFRSFAYAYHDKMAAECKGRDAKQNEIFIKYIPSLLFFIGYHGKLENKKELVVCGTDLLTVPKRKNERKHDLGKLSLIKTSELFKFLSEMGFYFKELNYSEKVDLSKSGQFYVTYENDENLIVGLKLLANAAMNIKSDFINIEWDFIRCVYYTLADEEPKKHKSELRDHIHLIPSDKKDWVLDLHNYLTEMNCKCDGKIKDFIRFTYTSRKTKEWVCNFEYKPTGFILGINTNFAKSLDGIASKLPASTLTALRADACGCGGACKLGPFRISHDGEEFVNCRYVGFQFNLENAEERDILKKWIEAELSL